MATVHTNAPVASAGGAAYSLPPIPRSILSNGAGLAVNAVISFLLTPFLIHRLGNFEYALWTLSASVVDYLSLLDLGMRLTLFRFISRLRGGDDRLSLNQTFASALFITIVMSFAVCLLTFVLIGVAPGFFGLSGGEREIFERLLLLLGLSAGATLPSYMLGTYLCAAGRFDLYNLASIATGLIRAALIVTGMAMGYRVVGIAAVTLGVALLSILLNWMLLRRADPGLALGPSLIRWPRIKELARFNFYASLTALGDFMRFYTDSVVIGAVIGVAAITPFNVATRLLYFFRQILVAVSSPLMGRIGELDGRGHDLELRRFFLRATNVTALVSVFLGAMLLLNGRDLIRLWVGEAFDPSYWLVVVLTVAYVVAFAQQPSLDAIMLRGRHRLRGWMSLAEGVANVSLSIALARRYGLVGVALGTAIPMLVVNLLILPRYALQAVGLSAGAYIRDGLARPAIVGALFTAIVLIANRANRASGRVEFAWTILWETAVFALLACVVVLAGADRDRLFAGTRGMALSVRRAFDGDVRRSAERGSKGPPDQ